MKQKRRLLVLVILGMLGLGCGVPSFLARAPTATPFPVKTLRPTFTPIPSATNTVPPTITPIVTDTPLPTDTPVPPTKAAELPPSAPPADSPQLPTPTLEPPAATMPLQPTAVPPTTVPPTTVPPTTVPPTEVPPTRPSVAKHVVGTHGVSGLVVARDKTTFAIGEKAFFTYEAINHTQNPVSFVMLGIKASNGQFNTSWVNPDVISPGTPFKHDDGMAFNRPGTYRVMLAICFSRCGEADADWEEFPYGAATITVQ